MIALSRTRRALAALTKNNSATLVLLWTALVAASLFWNTRVLHDNTLERARVEARALHELNLMYRQWSAGHGGVYVPVTDTLKPNPYLRVPDRDVTTTGGKRLTLVNPAWLTRQVFELLDRQSSLNVVSHITSLKYLNPVNRPDPWEEKGLMAFEQGLTEVTDATTIGGQPYMRLLSPFKTERPCLKCHAHQGYKAGDIRGGISIAVPLKPYLDIERKEKRSLLLAHAFFWVIGGGGIALYAGNARKQRDILAGQEARYRLLFDSNPHPLWVYDLETLRFLMVNDAAVRRYGYSREEFLSMTIADIRPPEDVPGLVRNVVRVVDGIDYAGTWRHRKKDGSLIFVEIISHVLDFAGRRAELVLAHDVTDRMRLEDQLRQAQKMEAVGQLAGGVAHDFNNILTAIIGYGNVLQMKMREETPLRPYVEQILSAADKAAVLTHGLLAFSRRRLIDPRPVSVNEFVSRTGRLLQRLLREDIELRITPSAEDLSIMADSVHLEQVLMNLAANAMDAMPGGGALTIECRKADLGEHAAKILNLPGPGVYALVRVSDTGVGMTEKTLEKIFEPFFTTKETGRGTGLGLSMAYGTVTQHSGRIVAESEPGKGSTFSLYLPVITQGRGKEPEQAAPPPPEGGRETILVAEDNEAIRQLAVAVLREFGYTVIEAVDGEDALVKFSENRDAVRMLLLDVIMPKKNGKAVYDEVRKTRPEMKALFISGYAADVIHRHGILDEGLTFISKPVSLKTLLKEVREVLDKEPRR
jgi:PAS domain S-box-containing protein